MTYSSRNTSEVDGYVEETYYKWRYEGTTKKTTENKQTTIKTMTTTVNNEEQVKTSIPVYKTTQNQPQSKTESAEVTTKKKTTRKPKKPTIDLDEVKTNKNKKAKKTSLPVKNKQEYNTPESNDKNDRVITHGELVSSIVSAAQGGVLGTIVLTISILGLLCSKGVLTISPGPPPTAFLPQVPQTSTVQKTSYTQNSRHKNRKIKNQHKNYPSKLKEVKESRIEKRKEKKTKVKSLEKKVKHSNKRVTPPNRELTWKTRTCFSVDKTATMKTKSENLFLKAVNQATKSNRIYDSKRVKSYKKSPKGTENRKKIKEANTTYK